MATKPRVNDQMLETSIVEALHQHGYAGLTTPAVMDEISKKWALGSTRLRATLNTLFYEGKVAKKGLPGVHIWYHPKFRGTALLVTKGDAA